MAADDRRLRWQTRRPFPPVDPLAVTVFEPETYVLVVDPPNGERGLLRVPYGAFDCNDSETTVTVTPGATCWRPRSGPRWRARTFRATPTDDHDWHGPAGGR
ncbi:MAG: hypothetical protein ABEJ08_01380 [Halobacteriaceae archaeon]